MAPVAQSGKSIRQRQFLQLPVRLGKIPGPSRNFFFKGQVQRQQLSVPGGEQFEEFDQGTYQGFRIPAVFEFFGFIGRVGRRRFPAPVQSAWPCSDPRRVCGKPASESESPADAEARNERPGMSGQRVVTSLQKIRMFAFAMVSGADYRYSSGTSALPLP